MKCPFCGHTESHVRDSRAGEDHKTIRRRRECGHCQRRFTTFERFQTQQIIVIKRDGTRELFESDKLAKALSMALRKRPIDPTAITQMAVDIETDLAESGATEVTSREIGDEVLDALKKVDFVGYMRYASVYNAFEKPEDFKDVINQFTRRRKRPTNDGADTRAGGTDSSAGKKPGKRDFQLTPTDG